MDTHDGADVDDRAAPLAKHHGRNGVDEVEGALEVDRQHGIPLRLAHTEHQAVLGNARVVDEDIDAAEGLHDLLHGLVRLFEIGGIGGNSQHTHAEGFEFFFRLQARLVDDQVRKGDISAFFRKFEGNLFADAPRCARNQRNLSFQKFHISIICFSDNICYQIIFIRPGDGDIDKLPDPVFRAGRRRPGGAAGSFKPERPRWA